MTDRLGRLVDRHLYNTDVQYHADVRRVSHLIEMTRMALEDEGVAPDVIERVVNRLVYGVPSGADAYERIERFDAEVKRAMVAPLQPILWPGQKPGVHDHKPYDDCYAACPGRLESGSAHAVRPTRRG